jgi:hypothetical protein
LSENGRFRRFRAPLQRLVEVDKTREKCGRVNFCLVTDLLNGTRRGKTLLIVKSRATSTGFFDKGEPATQNTVAFAQIALRLRGQFISVEGIPDAGGQPERTYANHWHI